MLPQRKPRSTTRPFPLPNGAACVAGCALATAVLLGLASVPAQQSQASDRLPARATDRVELAATTVSTTSADVTFDSGTATLHGTVISPSDTPGRHPAVVVIAGAGGRKRDAYRAEAEAFARAGIVTLIYDKRGDYSRATSSYHQLAADALAGLELLRARKGVDPGRVGVWGHSEGGWVAPLAASESTDVSFVVTAGASAWPADRTQL